MIKEEISYNIDYKLGELVESIVEFIIKRLLEKKIVHLSSIENSFFIHKVLDRDVRINKSIINLNYGSESPYPEKKTVITSILDDSKLYLWFINGDTPHRFLPEAYILFRRLLKSYNDIIFIIQGESDKVILIKDNTLISSFSKLNIRESDIQLMKEEYRIDKVTFLKEEEYLAYLESSIQYLRWRDIFNILNINIDIKSFFIKSIYFLSFPLFVSSIVISSIIAGYSYYVNVEKERLYSLFKEKQSLNSETKKSIIKNENENILYENLMQEFKYIDKSVALSKIIEVTDDMNMTMFYIKIYENRVDFIVKTKNNKTIPIYVQELFRSNLFEDIKNINTRKLRDSVLEVTMNAKLKEIE